MVQPFRALKVLGPDSLLLPLAEGCCIRTAARRAHGELTRSLLAGAALHPAAGLLELLTDFLSTADFAYLRSARPELAGSRRTHVRLFRQTDGAPDWEVVPDPSPETP